MKNANTQPEFDNARAAVEAFKRVTPQLNAVARSLTGNPKVRVVPGQGTYTDGETITVMPPVALAKRIKHIRSLCSQYNENGSMCPACRSRERVMHLLYHEMSHIIYHSFAPLTDDSAMVRLRDAATEAYLEGYLARTSVGMTGLPGSDTFKSMVAHLNAYSSADPHLARFYLFTEDMRINEAGWQARPGTRATAYAAEQELLDAGCQQADGTYSFWGDQPIDMQIMAASIFLASGHPLAGHFDDEVVDLMCDDEVHQLIVGMPHRTDVYDTAIGTIELLVAFRKRGYLAVEPDDEEEDNDDQDADAGDSGEDSRPGDSGSAGDDAASSGDDPSGDSDGGGDPSTDAEADGQDGDDSKVGEQPGTSRRPRRSATQEELERLLKQLVGHAGEGHAAEETGDPVDLEGVDTDTEAATELDPADQEKLKKLVNVMHALDRVPRNVDGVVEFGRNQGGAWDRADGDRWHDLGWRPSEAIVGKSVARGRIAFTNNARVQHHRNERSGRIAGNVLGKRAALGDDRLFKRKTVPDKRNYHVLFALDASGSMYDGTMTKVKRAARALADMCHRLGVDFSIYAHSTEGSFWSTPSLSIYEIKAPGEAWSTEVKSALATVNPVSGNLDGHSLQYYRKKLDAVKATDKVLMYFTDGAMPAENYAEELAVLQTEIEICRRRKYTLLGVGLGTDSPRGHGLDTVLVNSEGDYPKVIEHLSRTLLKR